MLHLANPCMAKLTPRNLLAPSCSLSPHPFSDSTPPTLRQFGREALWAAYPLLQSVPHAFHSPSYPCWLLFHWLLILYSASLCSSLLLQDYFINLVDTFGPLGYVAYIAVYAALEVLAVPAIPLTMTAGVIFGVLPGTAVVSVAGTMACTISFLIARYVARDKVGRGQGRQAAGGWAATVMAGGLPLVHPWCGGSS